MTKHYHLVDNGELPQDTFGNLSNQGEHPKRSRFVEISREVPMRIIESQFSRAQCCEQSIPNPRTELPISKMEQREASCATYADCGQNTHDP